VCGHKWPKDTEYHFSANSFDMSENVHPRAIVEADNHPDNQEAKEEAHHPSQYDGSGTISDPFVVEFFPGDPHNPLNFSDAKKWLLTAIFTMSVFAITLTSSAYSGAAESIIDEFGISKEVYALGISLFVLGFAIGPAFWAPLSELFGRQILFVVTHGGVVAFVAASAGCRSIASLLVFRFLSGTFGASPLTNAGGVIADLFPPAQRGLAMSLFCTAPFLGPVLGPTIGGFIAITIGWRWIQGVCCIFIGSVWIVGIFVVPETYGPVLLQKMAKQLSRKSGKVYISVMERNNSNRRLSEVFGKALSRPWVLLFREPIVLIASVYLSILYGTIYMFLGAFPIVYQQGRGWNEGLGGLAFMGLVVGMLLGLTYTIIDNKRYKKLGKGATPEARLPPGIIGAIALPVGMFSFAWTNSADIHWSASIILSAPFGFGTVLIFLSCLNYLLDAYTIYAASVLGAGAILRAFFGTAFPLFTSQMFEKLGIHWASSIPAFLTVACLPFPFVMYRYGAAIRMKCKYAKEAAVLIARMQTRNHTADEDST
jgi:MFS family permease